MKQIKNRYLILTMLLHTWSIHANEAINYSPVVGLKYPTQVFWGDTHLHTNNSADAFTYANTSLSATDAYKFARGEEITSQFGLPVQLREPLDFLVITDHAEFLGIFLLLDAEDPDFLQTRLGKYWHENIRLGKREVVVNDFVKALTGGSWDYAVEKNSYISIWDSVTKLADQFNDPGRFTTFSGYEWSSMPDGNNLHRNVIFKDDADKVTKIIPFSAIDSSNPEDLWAFLAAYEKDTGGEALAIPHNPNVSNGLMFAPHKLNGGKIDSPYATLRARWEPVLEVTQMKGDSESHPFLSPGDEFANFENWDKKNVAASAPKEDWMLKFEYARSALKMGLQYQQTLKANPFKFGMIGSTDSHTSLSTADENNFYGKFPLERPSATRATSSLSPFYVNWRLSASGYAAVWAQENTRQSIFAALKRREVYASTGPRIVLRFFAGWDYSPEDVHRADLVDIGYKQGVPMGADLLRPVHKNSVPRFMVTAAKDPSGANLDRIQIIKGWIDENGAAHEKIFNVALSNNRKPDPLTGEAPAVGNTVIIAEATYSNSIGDAALVSYWQDSEFDPDTPAFYYVRVLEIPTPRWTAYDAKFFNLDLPDEIPMWQQERIYSSPIWYSP